MQKATSASLLYGDAVERLRELEPESVHCVVTDPPYGLHFMGKGWDKFGGPLGVDHQKTRERSGSMHAGQYDYGRNSEFQIHVYSWAVEALRVLKPGGHLVAFGGSRTHHRLWCALEDAGFEIRDTLMWLFGSGFPKSLDVSKAIDKAAGAEREVVGESSHASGISDSNLGPQSRETDHAWSKGNSKAIHYDLTAPATDAAREWDGWGTALKPAWEPIVLARKPPIGTVAANVQAHGTGALNIDGCRVSGDGLHPVTQGGERQQAFGMGRHQYDVPAGRWPANLVLDEESAQLLDAQSGELTSGANPSRRGSDKFRDIYSDLKGQEECLPARGADSGGASRFFYCAKASREEREAGVRGFTSDGQKYGSIRQNRGKGYPEATPARNNHPTVKPVALMRWLVRLVTPPGGVILDPFIGSGTTAVAAILEGFECIGIDNNEEYLQTARERIKRAELEREHGSDGANQVEAGQVPLEAAR